MTRPAPVARSDCLRLWVAVVATALFVAAAQIQSALRPDYDTWHQAVSALSLGPTGWVQDTAFVLLGLALLSTVPVWRRVLTGGIGARAYPVLTALTGIGLVSAGWIPQDPAPGYDPEQLGHALPTTTGLLHLAAAGVCAFSTCGALFVMAARFATLPVWAGWATYTRLCAAATIACVVVFAVWSTQASGFAGTFERLVILIPGLWGFALAKRLWAGVPI